MTVNKSQTPREIIESIPTSVLLRDTDLSTFESPEERGFNISKVLQKGALVCLAATLPVFEIKSYEFAPAHPEYSQPQEGSISRPSRPQPLTPYAGMDMSTLQDAVSGLGFLLDPPSPSTDISASSLPRSASLLVLENIPPSGYSV